MTQQINTKVAIIGAGITGLSISVQLAKAGIPFVILEKSDKPGGQICTRREKGYTFETGPNTGVMSTPEVAELFEYVHPYAKLEVARKEAAHRWIWKGDRFHSLPTGPISGLMTPLFTLKDKFGILLEPFRAKGGDPYESVGDLAKRRLGKSFVDYAVDPFVGGIYAGDPYQLTTQFALPKLYHLEQEYGSFIKGGIAKSRTPESEREKKATKEVFSAQGGLENLVTGIVKKISDIGKILTGVRNIQSSYIEPHCWEISYTTDSETQIMKVSHIVSTVRADLIQDIVPPDLHSLLSPVASLKYAPVTEITVGFDHLPNVRRNAFGGLIPSKEKRKILGVLFPSSCFRGRVPHEDSALFTIFMGGMRDGEAYRNLSDDSLKEIALGELYEMMQIPNNIKPDLVHISRHERAIPQYDISSEERFERIKELEKKYPGLHLSGGISDGIGLAHRISQGTKVGSLIVESLDNPNVS
ncbi:protoporphyrinogen oxidase [Porphyromonas sp.]|uniref:protoporphyrinogen oxidase n=1 Tax=Porphyromonas sp. TaxID=1924944 RepID=UPI0026DCDED0|nr:protoporphyrinogen oxidase [Porphyromonas sp.]MDO4695263.1 protoporphyrinogen oxidase [Porphyromonas sp.]MDO4771049.1 protoporphyrinogen oxidase [Porphyromonas sp.]